MSHPASQVIEVKAQIDPETGMAFADNPFTGKRSFYDPSKKGDRVTFHSFFEPAFTVEDWPTQKGSTAYLSWKNLEAGDWFRGRVTIPHGSTPKQAAVIFREFADQLEKGEGFMIRENDALFEESQPEIG